MIVGGGVVGAAVARELAPSFDVTLLERSGFGSGATGRAAGLVTLQPAYGHLPAVVDYGVAYLREFDGSEAFRFRERESFEFVTPEEARGHRAYADQLASDGLPASVLEREALAAYPVDADRFECAVRYEGTGVVDPAAFVDALLADAADRGATLRADAPVTAVRVADGRVTGVETAAGAIDACRVVVAAGWRTPELLAGTVEIPVRPYRTQCAVVDAPGAGAIPMGWVPDDGLYFRPQGERLLVGGWAAPTDDPANASRRADDAFREYVVDVLPRICPAAEPVRVVDDWAGVDGATPDAYPIVGAPGDAPEGLVVATGLHGRGVMSAGVVAGAVRSIAGGTDVPFPLDPFRIERFDSRSSDFPLGGSSARRE